MKISIKYKGGSFAKSINTELRQYKMEVGILQNEKKRTAKWGQYTTYAGQRLVKSGKYSKTETLVDVADRMDKKYSWLRTPFLNKNNADLIKVADYIVKDLSEPKEITKQRILNATQAVIRNPILRGDYGRNSPEYAKQKGFNKPIMLTGQTFKKIKARFI